MSALHPGPDDDLAGFPAAAHFEAFNAVGQRDLVGDDRFYFSRRIRQHGQHPVPIRPRTAVRAAQLQFAADEGRDVDRGRLVALWAHLKIPEGSHGGCRNRSLGSEGSVPPLMGSYSRDTRMGLEYDW